LLADTRAAVLLVQERQRNRVFDFGAVMLDLEEPEAAGDIDAGNPRNGATPDTLAYVMYTSGSTGFA